MTIFSVMHDENANNMHLQFPIDLFSSLLKLILLTIIRDKESNLKG